MTSTRRYERSRYADKPWRGWYNTKQWRGPAGRRTLQLQRVPWCEPCKRDGKATPATVANHVVPHRGDPLLFWHGRLESVCKECHDSRIQAAERAGFTRDLDDDGWPADPAHPFNRISRDREGE